MNSLDNTVNTVNTVNTATVNTASATTPVISDVLATEEQTVADNTCIFRPYDSALPVPVIKGYRNVKLLYKKNPKTKVAVAANSYIRVADYITEQVVADNIDILAEHIVGYLQLEEDKIIKEAHIAGAESWSWADIQNNGAVLNASLNPHNEMMDKS